MAGERRSHTAAGAQAMVSRVLPWRRSSAPVASQLDPVMEAYRRRWPKHDTALIRSAYDVAYRAHTGQKRKSGEQYILHPVSVARVVAEMGLDDISIAAALLHDAVEDTGVELDDVHRDFGAEVAAIVDGVTKLDRVRFESKEDQQSATLRKMLIAMARDMRVLLIKLSDRLHNMRTLGALSIEKQSRVATETLEIYAPLAHRLGMDGLKTELEDLAFAAMHPKRYAEMDRLLAERGPAQEQFVEDVLAEVRRQLDAMNISAQVTGRQKHLWSLYEKMVVKGRSFEEIFDLVGIRVVVPTVREAYAALGSIHATWKPVSGRFKDYIAMPKFNLYQSLHTTVIGPGGTSVEVQIRTEEMHRRAEHGVAAHWRYKDDDEDTSEVDAPWLTRIVDWQAETDDPEEFMRSLRVDLDQDEVYVFTPKGDVVSLLEGSTPIDFAYAIHTDVGHSTIGAKVDGRLVPLDRRLESGDTIEIFTSKVDDAGPSRTWLEMAATPKARARIRSWFNREDRLGAQDAGRDELVEVLRHAGLPANSLVNSDAMVRVGAELGHDDLDSLFEAIGQGSVEAITLIEPLERLLDADEGEQLPARPAARRGTGKKREAGVHVEGFDGVLVRLARCCNPVRGDEILGFATRGRGVSIHRTDCANAAELSHASGSRVVDAEWDQSFSGGFLVSVEVRGLDRNRLLADVVLSFSEYEVAISTCNAIVGDDHVSVMKFDVELGDIGQLNPVLGALRKVPSVFDAYRVMPSAAPG